MSRSTVSVVIPTYNCGAFVADAVESVLAQTSRPREIIVVDDGSSDDTEARLAPFRQTITYVRQPNQGAAAARNTGIARATSDYVAVLDADDRCHPDRLARQAGSLDESGAIACFTGHWVFDGAGTTRQFRANPRADRADAIEHLAQVLVLHPTLMFHRRRAVGLAYPQIPVAEDVVFAATLRARGAFTVCPEPLYGYRRRAGQATARYSFTDALERRLIWLGAHWHEHWPERTLVDLRQAMWMGAAETLRTFYWSRDKGQFLRLREYLRARWPGSLERPPQLALRWYPDWLWATKGRADALASAIGLSGGPARPGASRP
jgi:glycosyltransferase involved in cell wall biosynthesis